MKRIITTLALAAAILPSMAQSITVTSSRYVALGTGNMTVHYEGAPVGTDAWVGIYKSGDHKHEKSSFAWAYTTGESGDLTFDLPGWDAFYAVLFKDGGYTEIARSGYVMACNDYNGAQAEAFTMSTDKAVYTVGEPINVTWANGPGFDDHDWIAIYKKGNYPGLVGYSESYEYVGKNPSGTMTLKVDGNGSYSGPIPAGEYYITYLLWDQYAEIFDRVYFTVVDPKAEVEIGQSGYATYVAPRDLDFTSCAEVTAYTVSSVANGYVTLTEADAVPAGTAVVVKADAAGTYEVDAASETPVIGTNLLMASEGIDYDADATAVNYVLASKDGVVGFYPVTSGSIAEGKGYLQIAAAEAKAVYTFEETTAIRGMEATAKEASIFNLAGQRVLKAQKGIFIINGKKVLK